MNTKLIIPIIFAILLISNVLALSITSSSNSPGEVQPGEKVSITLTIKNNYEDKDIEDVKISLILNGEYTATGIKISDAVPFSPYQSSTQYVTDVIDQDKSKTLNFDLLTSGDAESGIYKIPVKMEYTVDDEKRTDEGVISIIVNAKPEFSVSSDNSGLVKGQTSEITIKIINSGLGDAKYTQVKIGNILNTRLTSTDNFYIGDINKDDFDSIKLSLNVNTNAPGLVTTPIELNYKDSRNNNFQEIKYLDVKAYTLKQAQDIGLVKKSNLGIYITLVVILIILYLVYRWLKKRRKNKLANGGN